MRVEVFAADGRRVASTAREAGAGQWTWTGQREDGGRAPAGVYFVRATDAAGHSGSLRLALVR